MRRSALVLAAVVLASGLALGVHGARAQVETPSPTTAAHQANRNEFAISFYRRLGIRPGNILASPYSLETALAMAQAGAGGDTAKEFAQLMGDDPASGPAVPAGDGLTFEVANALWARRGLPLKPDYVARMAARFDGLVGSLDFDAPASAANTINRWASDQTHGRIRSVVAPADISPDTQLVITDAVYFKGAWEFPFAAGETSREPFHLASGREVQADTMHQAGRFDLYAGEGFKLLAMPFKGGTEPVQVVLILPERPDGLSGLEARLSAAELNEWITSADERVVDVALPKFALADTVRLGDVVAAMGLPRAFSPELADFSGIAPLTRPRLHLSDVIQSVFVDLNESGTEAAAVTAITMGDTAARQEDVTNRSVRFTADHPFLYLIRDVKTGDILFIGRMEDPSAAQD